MLRGTPLQISVWVLVWIGATPLFSFPLTRLYWYKLKVYMKKSTTFLQLCRKNRHIELRTSWYYRLFKVGKFPNFLWALCQTTVGGEVSILNMNYAYFKNRSSIYLQCLHRKINMISCMKVFRDRSEKHSMPSLKCLLWIWTFSISTTSMSVGQIILLMSQLILE